MNRTLLLLIATAGLLLPACAFGVAPGTTCRITNIGADARNDANGNQLDVYDYKFFAEEPCGDTHVNASYNLGTQQAEEKLQRPGAQATGVWRCPADPWSNLGVVCDKVQVAFSGSVNPSEQELEQFAQKHTPMSVFPLVQLDQETLRGQLGNALKRLPPPVKQDEGPIDYGGCACDGTPANAGAPAAPAPAPNPTTGQLVQKGASGPNVEAIQYLLNQGGQDVDVDGDFGDQTVGAVRAFQGAKGLKVDGIVGPDTWRALWVTIRTGASQDDAVNAAQTLLNWHHQDIEVDGDFGDQTDDAVRAFQRAKGLPVDGAVGPATWTALVNSP